MIQNIPIEAVIGAATVIGGIAIAAYRNGTFTVSDDIDGDGEDETFDVDFTGGDDSSDGQHRLADAEPPQQDGPVDENGDAQLGAEDETVNDRASVQSGDVQTSPDFSNDEYSGLTDITGIGPTKAEALSQEAGISSPADVWYASDDTLLDVTGIGKSVVEQIRGDIGGIDYSTSEGNE